MKTKNKYTRAVFSARTLLTLTYAVTDLGSNISIPIYSELYTTIANVCCKNYFKNNDFLMTVVKFLNSKLLERIAAPANIDPANRNSQSPKSAGKSGAVGDNTAGRVT